MIRASILTFAVRGFAAAATFAMHVLVARFLGASGTGLFFVALSIMRGAMEVGRFGLNRSLVRCAAPALDDGNLKRVSRYCISGGVLTLGISISTALLVSIACAAVLPRLFPDRTEVWSLTTLFVWTAVPMALIVFSSGVAQTFGRPALASVLEVAIVPILASIGLIGFALVASPSSEKMAYIYLGSALLTAVGSAGIVLTWLDKARFRWAEAREMLAIGHPFLVVGGAQFLAQNAPLLILGMSATLDDAGVFSVAHRLAMALSILLTAINNVMFARFAIAWKRGERDRLELELQMSAVLMMAIGLPIIVVLGVFRTQILGLMGEDFESGGPFLLILLAGQLVNLLTASTGAVLAMTGNERALRNNSLVSGGVSVMLAILLIPPLGSLGASIAVASAIAVQSGLAAWQSWKLVGVKVLSLSMFCRRRM